MVECNAALPACISGDGRPHDFVQPLDHLTTQPLPPPSPPYTHNQSLCQGNLTCTSHVLARPVWPFCSSFLPALQCRSSPWVKAEKGTSASAPSRRHRMSFAPSRTLPARTLASFQTPSSKAARPAPRGTASPPTTSSGTCARWASSPPSRAKWRSPTAPRPQSSAPASARNSSPPPRPTRPRRCASRTSHWPSATVATL